LNLIEDIWYNTHNLFNKKGDGMSKVCLDNRTTQGLILCGAGIVLLLLGYYRNFLSIIVVLGALAAIVYGAIILGVPQRIKNALGMKK
jgi:hypothetical protein